MSAIILLPVVLPAAAAAWPAVATAAAAAASALGYVALRQGQEINGETEIELEVENCEAVTEGMALGESLVFSKEDVNIVFFRNTQGKIAVKARSAGKSEDELLAEGQAFTQAVVQQYAYHRVVSELKERNLNVVGEEVGEDGTVHLQVRTFQG